MGKHEHWGGPIFLATGLPGVGKSVFTRRLSWRTGLPLINGDQEIVKARKVKRLSEVSSLPNFTEIEGEIIAQTVESLTGPAIVDGGGSVYKVKQMPFIAQRCIVLLLTAPDEDVIAHIESRIERNGDDGGIDMEGCATYEELFAKRRPGYEKWANFTIHIINGDRKGAADLFAERLFNLRLVSKLRH